jgi:chromosome segregation ATPase
VAKERCYLMLDKKMGDMSPTEKSLARQNRALQAQMEEAHQLVQRYERRISYLISDLRKVEEKYKQALEELSELND